MRISRQTKRRTAVACATSALGLATPAGGQCQEPTQVLAIPDAGSVVLQGDLLVVRASDGGAPVLLTYRLVGGVWIAAGASAAANTGPMSVAGDLLALGRSPGDPAPAQIYRRAGDAWELEAELAPEDPTDGYAADVAISGDTVMLGQPDLGAGAVHIFIRDPAGWTQQETLAPPDPHYEEFGAYVAIDGALAAVAPAIDDSTLDGAVCAYRRSGATWELDGQLVVPHGIGGPSRVDLDGDQLIASTARAGGPARLYRFDGSIWTDGARLAGSRWITDQEGRGGVSVDGERALVVGAWHDADLDRRGVLYIHERAGDDWRLERRLLSGASPRPVAVAALGGAWVAAVAGPEVRLYDLTKAPGACPPGPPPDLDNGLRLSVDGMLSPQSPEVSVLASAFFEPRAYAFAAAHFDAIASEAGWTDPALILMGPGTTPGLVESAVISDVLVGQLNFPISWGADPSNPIKIWRAHFNVTDFTPRVLSLSLDTHTFTVYPDRESSLSEFRILGILDPEATIRVWRSSCLADCDGSGALDVVDFLCFQGLFDAGNLACDFDEDGLLTLFDFLAFQNEFAGGCP